MEYCRLDELSDMLEKDCFLQIKVSRTWEELDPNTGEILGLNLIFTDGYVSILNSRVKIYEFHFQYLRNICCKAIS